MERFYAHRFVAICTALTSVGTMIEVGVGGAVGDRVITPELRERILEHYSPVGGELQELGLNMTRLAVERLVENVSADPPAMRYKQLGESAKEISDRMIDEMRLAHFLSLDAQAAALFENIHPFGDEVAEAFPSVLENVEEAGKCLALGRGTACVFHLMRVMELGLRVLMRDMGEPYDPAKDSDWSRMLAKCNQRVGSGGAKQDFYRDAVTMLTTVKWSWRNPTMHPKNSYTEEEAREVWSSVRIFVRHLATQLAEEKS